MLADYQTAGKGQRGNSWESEAGANLTFSLVLYPKFLSASKQFSLSRVVALGIVQTLKDYIKEGISIKWPNDIYYHDKKLCGMLMEVYLDGSNLSRCICGIGLNVNQTKFVSDAPNPVSLIQITNRSIDRDKLLQRLLYGIYSYYNALSVGDESQEKVLLESYSDNLYRKDGMHPYRDKDGEFMARLRCVEPDGRLLLEYEKGQVRAYLFKEVQYII